MPGQQYEKGAHQLSLNGQDLDAGIYVCEVAVNNQFYRQKLILTR
ncbi:hypothetical protein [Rufibacter radiotolerans]|nr:hypothetical protein [Rufibacter radiotolerans]